jgi:hypothetical protein
MPNLNGGNDPWFALLSIGWLGREIGDMNHRFGR